MVRNINKTVVKWSASTTAQGYAVAKYNLGLMCRSVEGASWNEHAVLN